ncbi:flagellar hook-length control protein FliK [Microbacterium sp.]|uniref:flagellar hook-length control protein FliK n=1 Tax=Microbacterium sp. TaxID=51671 RepID=UPI0026285E26|nr:flagellar hook-length control protein FliK [Microbacterium sp.]MCV0336158.1 flagellar hook-length control protein FliK [Microbacterium sp.]MCV0377086.1 flagellar hook-length control protein FliK [Microbacterium sp.]MCV0390411.1 flagellar hook-length control protein FliK [Microbacterium sp.]MCV0418146.1 flagellar hook-length control protein FliK [Microbacterium sp.]MCV0422186.1 flagellar hook-length control protein FliK [Microbacterium sp.]
MTSLGIVDLLGARTNRASGTPAHSRQVTPGAAAFADVILDASRASTDALAGSSAASSAASSADGSSAGGSSADGSASDAPIPSPPAVLPAPTPSHPASPDGAVVGIDGSAARAPLVPGPAPDGADPTTTAEGTLEDEAGAAGLATHTVSNGAPVTSSAAPAAAPANTQTPALATSQSSTPGPTVAPVPGGVAPAVTAAIGTAGHAAPSANPALPSVPRISVGGNPTPTVLGGPGAPIPTTRTGTSETSVTVGDSFPDAATSAAAATSTPVATASPSPTATPTATPGDAALPPVGTTPAPAPVTSVAAPVAVPTARPALLPQIAAPVVSLAQAPDGDHSLTLTVSPENLGPVTVRAHISGGAIHIELHAPNDLGREALRAILIDLRRDLAAAAPHASLLLSNADDGPASSNPQHSAPGNGTGSGSNGGSGNGATGTHGGQPGTGTGRDANALPTTSDGALPTDPSSPADPASPPSLIAPHGGIDVFA